MNTTSNLVELKGLTVVGKIVLPTKTASKSARKFFKPFSGGSTIGERMKAQGIRL